MQVSSRERLFADLCSELVRRLRLLERSEFACCGVPMSRAMVLRVLAADACGCRMSRVADSLGVAQSTATRLVEPLEREGLVERCSDTDDGRAVVAVLTDEGWELARQLVDRSQIWSHAILQRIPPAQREGVIESLQKVVDAVEGCCSQN